MVYGRPVTNMYNTYCTYFSESFDESSESIIRAVAIRNKIIDPNKLCSRIIFSIREIFASQRLSVVVDKLSSLCTSSLKDPHKNSENFSLRELGRHFKNGCLIKKNDSAAKNRVSIPFSVAHLLLL